MTQDAPAFTLTVNQNRYLAVGSTTAHAIVRIAATDTAADAELPTAAEVVIIDKSTSMMKDDKIAEARRAAAAAVGVLRDGTDFAVVAGQGVAEQIYPPSGMVAASDRTREEAVAALSGVTVGGGTTISTWLHLADRLLAESTAELKHVLLLTDGENTEGERPLREVLGVCEGRFVCDCRGVGGDWRWEQLKEIASTLHGDLRPVEKPEQLAEAFRAVMHRAMRKRVADVRLRVKMPPGARLIRLARVSPSLDVLTDKATWLGEHEVEFPLGSWGEESRDYDIRFRVSQDAIGIENEGKAGAGRLAVTAPAPGGGSQTAAKGTVLVSWTYDAGRAARMDPLVAYYAGHQDLAEAVDEGLNAWGEREADSVVEAKLGRAVALAHDRGRADLLEHLAAFVRIVDPEAGHVSLLERNHGQNSHINSSKHLSEVAEPPEDEEAAVDEGSTGSPVDSDSEGR